MSKSPFDPKTGAFAENIRSITKLDDSELRASLQQFGWSTEFPAMMDEHGVVLVGHRRLKIAKELGIKPVIKKFSFGSGTAADAERLKLALVSNIGAQAMTKQDRENIAKHLYGTRQWTMERIGAALNVSQKTISKDLSGIYTKGINQKSAKTASNPKGSGRPHGSTKPPRAERQPHSVEREARIEMLSDAGLSAAQIAAEVGLGERAVHQSLEHVEIRREAAAKIDPATLAMSAQEKLAAAIRQEKKKLETEFMKAVLLEVKKRIEQTVLPHYRKEQAEFQKVIKSRKGVMTKAEFKLVLTCLHPDRIAAFISDAGLKKRFADAYHLINDLEVVLLDETQHPTGPGFEMPSTYEELMALKRKVSEERKAQRGAKRGGIVTR